MSLTGTTLLCFVVAAVVVAMIVTAFGWNRVRGPRPLRWTTRLTMIGACQITAVALVAVWINDSNDFYTSWADLLGEQAEIPVAQNIPTGQAKVDRGEDGVTRIDYHGPESNLNGRVLVWTPPQYDQPDYRNYRFPVIMLLHGNPGSPRNWVKGGAAPTKIADMMADGSVKPSILVMPQTDPNNVNTDCTDLPGARNATWLAHDVTSLIKRQFRVLDTAAGWGVVGFSTGGYCATKLTLQYPKTFASAVALSPDHFEGDPDVIADPTVRAANDPVRLAATGIPVSIFIATTDADRFSTPDNAQELYRAAKWPTMVAEPLILPDGGHNWGTWHAIYPVIFPWLSGHLAAPHRDSTTTVPGSTLPTGKLPVADTSPAASDAGRLPITVGEVPPR